MVVLTLLAGSGGAACAAAAAWPGWLKPWIEKKLAFLVGAQGPQFLGGSECEAAQVSFTLGSTTSLVVSGLQIRNLPPYPPNPLLKLDSIEVIVDVVGSLRTGFQRVDVLRLSVAGCALTFDKGLTSSNVQELMGKMADRAPASPSAGSGAGTGTGHEGSGQSVVQSAACCPCAGMLGSSSAPATGGREIVLGDLVITRITVANSLHFAEGCSTPGVAIPAPDIQIRTFSKKFGSPRLTKLIHMLVMDILTSGKRAVVAASDTTLGAVEDIAQGASSWFSGWFS